MIRNLKNLAFLTLASLYIFSFAHGNQSPAQNSFPQFISLKGSKAHLRTGPGRNFPIEWVYQARGLPLKVVAQYDKWYKVEDIEGSSGWMHHSLFSSNRTVQIRAQNSVSLQSEPTYASQPIAWIDTNVVGIVIECPKASAWCEADFNKYRGYIERKVIWGVLDNEIINRKE